MKKKAESIKKPLREFISAEFRTTRKRLGFTKARMAEELGIDVRSYSLLESGENLCSTTVFIRYIAKFKQTNGAYPESKETTAAESREESKETTAPDTELVQTMYRIMSSAESRLV